MPENDLTPETNFTVRESRWLNLIVGILLFAVVIVSMSFYKVDSSVIVILLPALFFISKGFSDQVAITINKKGFYERGSLVTSWNNFIRAYVADEEVPGSIQDNFAIVIEYKKDGETGYYKRAIRLTNSQNKTDEEIMEAIKFFSSQTT